MDEVLEVKGVSVDESIYLAPRVKQLSRFRLEEIRRQAHKRIKERYPKASIHVSTDKKIYIELEKLEERLQEQSISKKQLDEKIKQLETWMKG